jgi:hypothetical protein
MQTVRVDDYRAEDVFCNMALQCTSATPYNQYKVDSETHRQGGNIRIQGDVRPALGNSGFFFLILTTSVLMLTAAWDRNLHLILHSPKETDPSAPHFCTWEAYIVSWTLNRTHNHGYNHRAIIVDPYTPMGS